MRCEVSYETDLLDVLCSNLRETYRAREAESRQVVQTASSIYVHRLIALFEESDEQDFNKWITYRYESHVSPFRAHNLDRVDPYLQMVFDITKTSADSHQIRESVAKLVNKELKERGFTRGIYETNLYFTKDI